MTKVNHTEWLRWAASLTNAEIDSALATIEWLRSRPCADAARPFWATNDGAHYLAQERGNRAADARIAAARVAA